MTAKNITDIVNGICTYEEINKWSEIKMRNRKNGIKLPSVVYYQFVYSKKDNTRQNITSNINCRTDSEFARQSYDEKANNVPILIYCKLFDAVKEYYNSTYADGSRTKLIAIDGTYNNDNKYNDILNTGLYDITNGIPIDITSCGQENKNREIWNATEYIKNNMETFKNSVIICDRGYFSYDFINMLIKKGIKFIIRVKGNGSNLTPSKKIRPSTTHYNEIMEIRKNTKVITYNNIIEKTIYSGDSKKHTTRHSLKIKNDCVLVTNLLDDKIYTDEVVLDYYRSRWDIEVFYKHLKANHKFQHMKEDSSDKHTKIYICNLIITYIAKIVEAHYTKKLKESPKIKKPNKRSDSDESAKIAINKSNLVTGIFDILLYDIFIGELTENKLNNFCGAYIKMIKNKKDRKFPRISKKPFSKWYIKSYSNLAKYMKIIDAIKTHTISKLDKNLKTIANNIISIDGIIYKSGD